MQGRPSKLAFSVLTAALVLSACGATSNTSSTSSGLSTGLVDVKIGIVPTAEFAPVYVAQEQGIFAQQGLSVEITTVASAAAAVPAVLNGQLQFGASATPPFFIAVEKGLPIKAVVANAGVEKSTSTDLTAKVLVQDGSPINGPTDLEGKKVGVNALGSMSHVAVSALVTAAGGDPKKVSFVVMPFPDEEAALRQGRVDAIATSEPFLTQSVIAGGVRSVAPLFAVTYPAGTTYALMFASQQEITDHPDVVQRFQRAMMTVNQLVSSKPELLRAALVKYGKLPQDLADKVVLPPYSQEFGVSGMQKMADLMVQDGFLSKKLDVTTALVAQK